MAKPFGESQSVETTAENSKTYEAGQILSKGSTNNTFKQNLEELYTKFTNLGDNVIDHLDRDFEIPSEERIETGNEVKSEISQLKGVILKDSKELSDATADTSSSKKTRREFLTGTIALLGGYTAAQIMKGPLSKISPKEDKISTSNLDDTESWLQRKSKAAAAKHAEILNQQDQLPRHNAGNKYYSDPIIADTNRELQQKLGIPGSDKSIDTYDRLTELSQPELRDQLLKKLKDKK